MAVPIARGMPGPPGLAEVPGLEVPVRESASQNRRRRRSQNSCERQAKAEETINSMNMVISNLSGEMAALRCEHAQLMSRVLLLERVLVFLDFAK